MILNAFETLLDREPPEWVRKFEVAALMGVFVEAFDVEAPALEDLSAEEALAAYRAFTAICMETAMNSSKVAAANRVRLGEGACRLGAKVRRLLGVRPSQAMRVTRFFYRGIGITLEGDLPGGLQFGPCYFSRRYTPEECWFMSAFDEGFMRGITGRKEADLVFECRLTEGASCCRAQFMETQRNLEVEWTTQRGFGAEGTTQDGLEAEGTAAGAPKRASDTSSG